MSHLELKIMSPTDEFVNRLRQYATDNGLTFIGPTDEGSYIMGGALPIYLKIFAETVWEFCEANDIKITIDLHSVEKIY